MKGAEIITSWSWNLLISIAWAVGAHAVRNQIRPRRFFAFAGIFLASLYWGPWGLAELQRSLQWPDPPTASVPLIGYFAGFVLGPALALAIGYLATKSLWVYTIAQGLTIVFILLHLRLGPPP